ncbi:MAG TPA: urea carboxylase-associated family protein [Kiloniellales bacterium]|nr:urea carboxylase-associated family protein [Kiloniellales bacterium]
MTDRIEVAGGYGKAFPLQVGQALRIVNTFGSQTVDCWALALPDSSEYLSVEHTRRMLWNLFPRQGDRLFSNRRSAMLLLEEDSSVSKHDMLFACCDPWLYKHYGCAPGHRNCRDNFREALFAAGYDSHLVPNPLNLWMNVPVADSERLALIDPVSKPGDHVLLRALMDCVVVLSACPMDVMPVNGPDRTPKPVHCEIVG